MATRPLNIVLTNDDVYNAPGITTMYAALVAAGYNVHIVAPAVNQSAQGSSLGGVSTVASPIAITQFSAGNYFVSGRPATAALVGLDDLAGSLSGGQAPDLIISGTNRGDNIGLSENISGTVNGALQGLFEDIAAIAVSAGSSGGSYDAAFVNAGTFTADLVARLDAGRTPGTPLLPACRRQATIRSSITSCSVRRKGGRPMPPSGPPTRSRSSAASTPSTTSWRIRTYAQAGGPVSTGRSPRAPHSDHDPS